MADIFVSYTRNDQATVRHVVTLLEAQGWSVWWDTRIAGGERWDEVIEREITAARCVVVVWTPQSISREWVHLEAHHGRSRGVLVPLLVGVDKPPFAFSLIQARDLSGWDGSSKAAVVVQFLADVRQKLVGGVAHTASQPQPSPAPSAPVTGGAGDAEREWRSLGLDASDDPGLLMAFAAKWERADPVWTYKGKQKALEAAVARYRAEGRIKVDAKIVHEALEGGWFKPGAGKTEWFKDLDVGPEMVVVPAGTFTKGWGDPDEPPQHVTIKAPFAAGRCAVTFAEWDAAGLPHKPGDQGWGRGRRPVINVSWEDAQAYVSWLSKRTGKTYRLLSEAEWEYCCRAGATGHDVFGDDITESQAQFRASQTAEVGSFAPNAWGLYDMLGNVWEWCADKAVPDRYSEPGEGDCYLLRGGAWDVNDLPDALFWATALWLPDSRDKTSGFRVARTL